MQIVGREMATHATSPVWFFCPILQHMLQKYTATPTGTSAAQPPVGFQSSARPHPLPSAEQPATNSRPDLTRQNLNTSCPDTAGRSRCAPTHMCDSSVALPAMVNTPVRLTSTSPSADASMPYMTVQGDRQKHVEIQYVSSLLLSM